MKQDTEVQAMQAAHAALANLKPEEQQRALRWLSEKLNVPGGAPILSAPPGGPASGPTSSAPPGASGIPGAATTPKAFMAAKRPTSGPERVACLGFIATNMMGQAEFAVKDLNDLNKKAAQPRIGNPNQAAADAVRAQYLTTSGRGIFQITPRGEAIVGALPDREKVKAALAEHPTTRSKRSGPKRKAKAANK